MDQGIISIFKTYDLRNAFHKAVNAVDSDSCDGFWESILKTFLKRFTILNVIKNIADLWEKVKISTVTGTWKKLIPVPHELL